MEQEYAVYTALLLPVVPSERPRPPSDTLPSHAKGEAEGAGTDGVKARARSETAVVAESAQLACTGGR